MEVGKQIRIYRKRKNMTIKELADKIGKSTSYLSQIETDQTNLSVSLLEEIAGVLEIPGYLLLMTDFKNQVSLVRRQDRLCILRKDGVKEYVLINQQGFSLDAFILEIPNNYIAPEVSIHKGEEFCLVLEGEVTVILNEVLRHNLEADDCVFYPSNIPHRLESKRGAKLLFSSSPPTFSPFV